MPGWNPNSGRKYIAAKSCNISLSPSDLELVDERARLLGTGRSGAIRSLLRDARRAARTGVAPTPALVYVPEAPRPPECRPRVAEALRNSDQKEEWDIVRTEGDVTYSYRDNGDGSVSGRMAVNRPNLTSIEKRRGELDGG